MAKRKKKKSKKKGIVKKIEEEKSEDKYIIKADLLDGRITTESSNEACLLYEKSRFGTLTKGRVQLSMLEALYLIEKTRLKVKEKRKFLTEEELIKKARKLEPNFWIRYCVFKDLRARGYVVKTALKFGADFRVYDRGIKPGEDHAKWVVFPVHESSTLTWHEFSAKNRVAHSTRKRLLIGVVDDEGDVTYYEIRWTRP